MAELIHEHSTHVRSPEGIVFIARTYGERRSDGTWEGWLEFIPVDDNAPPIPSGRETTQPKRTDLEYWAQGLTRVYLQGALTRAQSPTQAIERDRAERGGS